MPVVFYLSSSQCTVSNCSGLQLKCVSRSVVPNSLRPHGLQPTRLLCPWDFPGKDTGVGGHFLLQGIFPTQGSNPGLLHYRQILYQLSYKGKGKKSEVAQSCLTLCDPVDCSLQGSSVHGILQARILEWVAISFSRGSSWPRDRTRVSCIAGRCFTLWATREAPCQNWTVSNPLCLNDPNFSVPTDS